jgi:uncharacterized membrane protein YoaK (UPF0700 family)
VANHTLRVVSASLFGLFAMGVQSALVRLLVQSSPSSNVMTTNTTQFAIDAIEFLLEWLSTRSAPAESKAASERTEIMRRLNKVWPVMFGFFLGTLPGAVAYVRLGLWCLLLGIAIIGTLSVWAPASDKIHRTSPTALTPSEGAPR